MVKTSIHSLLLSIVVFKKATASAVNNKSTHDGYSLEVFECDRNLKSLPTAERQRKIPGSSYRLCFQPNEKALADGVGIERIDHFNWELQHRDGVAKQQAVINGNGDNVLSILTCTENKKLCYLDSMLVTAFYVDSGSVLGYGAATFTGNNGAVVMERFLFPHDFKFTMLNADGSEMNEEELSGLMQRMAEQEANAGTVLTSASSLGIEL